jgi:hypothetical protein
MIVGRSPRNPVIGDTVLLRPRNGRVSPPSSTRTPFGAKCIGATRAVNLLGIPAPN